MNKKKIKEEYRERIRNRETVCITLNMIPKIINNDDNWKVFYKGWSIEELKKLYRLLYMSAGYKWMDKDKDLF